MDEKLRQFVRRRAGQRCEYCRYRQEYEPVATYQVEHIIPKQHGGDDQPDNLALACISCNLHKGPNLAGLDPATGRMVRLFHPRRDTWEKHFVLSGVRLRGRTPTGRTTVEVLAMNAPPRLAARAILRSTGQPY